MIEQKNCKTDSTPQDKPDAYYRAVVRNSIKNEYRQNAVSSKYILPQGLDLSGFEKHRTTDNDIENQISMKGPTEWLMLIEDERLHTALCKLKPKDLELIYTYCKFGFTERQMAEHMGVCQSVMHRRLKRIKRIIKTFYLENGIRTMP